MSTLALRNYGLVLPKNYVSIEKDEMEYIDGGWYINNSGCWSILMALGATIQSSPATVASLVTYVGAGGLAASFSAIPVIGWIVGGYGAWLIINSAESFSSALCEAVTRGKGVEVNIGFRWFSPYLKCSAK